MQEKFKEQQKDRLIKIVILVAIFLVIFLVGLCYLKIKWQSNISGTDYLGSCGYKQDMKISTFFNDATSRDILSEKYHYDISSFNLLCGPGSTAKTDEYGFKIINAFKQLGYFFSVAACGPNLNIHNDNNIGVILLNAYQRDNGFSESKYVDREILQKLNDQIHESEMCDELLAKNFACYNYIKETPLNDASKKHRAFLLNLAMSVFPEKLQIKEKNCENGQVFGMISCDENSTPGYWVGYDDNCNAIITNVELPIDDYLFFSTMIHEYTHLIDKKASLFDGVIDTTNFYNISFDVSDNIEDEWDFYKVRIDVNDNEKLKQHFFSYAEGWVNLNNSKYRTASEDFAVSVEMYVTNGNVFRDYMKDKPIFQKKYNWIKQNVFDGREFNTGDPNYKEYIPDLSLNGLSNTGVIASGGILELSKKYRWDYQVK